MFPTTNHCLITYLKIGIYQNWRSRPLVASAPGAENMSLLMKKSEPMCLDGSVGIAVRP